MNEQSHGSPAVDRSADPVRDLEKVLDDDRQRGLADLNELFRAGQPPDPPLNGQYDGELVALDIAPIVTPVVEWIASIWMPWKGKFLIRDQSKGDNLFSQDSRIILSVVFPFYRDKVDHDHRTFRAFVFDTSIRQGMVDKDRQVFRIDYDRPDNPMLSIRRIVDEVVQVRGGVYLGKIHFKWWWGRWSMIGYFALRRKN